MTVFILLIQLNNKNQLGFLHPNRADLNKPRELQHIHLGIIDKY